MKSKRKPLRIKSLSAFVSAVASVQKEIQSDHEIVYPWFRGHWNKDHLLQPSLYRNGYEPEKNLDHQYRHDFRMKAYPYLGELHKQPANELEWYIVMQHYGLPTRLLDWSEGSLIALHFALRDAKEDIDPCVWALNPFVLNKKLAGQDDFIVTQEFGIVEEHLPKIWSNKKIPSRPVAIQPPLNSKRIVAQKGCFTIHGSNVKPLEEYKKLAPFLQRIDIAHDAVYNIKEELQVSGMTETLIYPELAGLGRELIDYWKE